MDVVLIVLFIMALAMGLMTFLQYRNMKARRMRRMMPQQPNPYVTQPPSLQPQYPQMRPQQAPLPENIRQSTQNINKVANPNYRQVYSDVAKEMLEKKQANVKNKQAEILQQKQLHEMLTHKKDGREFGRTVDVQSWEMKNLYGINENKQPMEKVEYLEPKVEQQQYWQQNQRVVWGLLGFCGFMLFLILVM